MAGVRARTNGAWLDKSVAQVRLAAGLGRMELARGRGRGRNASWSAATSQALGLWEERNGVQGSGEGRSQAIAMGGPGDRGGGGDCIDSRVRDWLRVLGRRSDDRSAETPSSRREPKRRPEVPGEPASVLRGTVIGLHDWPGVTVRPLLGETRFVWNRRVESGYDPWGLRPERSPHFRVRGRPLRHHSRNRLPDRSLAAFARAGARDRLPVRALWREVGCAPRVRALAGSHPLGGRRGRSGDGLRGHRPHGGQKALKRRGRANTSS